MYLVSCLLKFAGGCSVSEPIVCIEEEIEGKKVCEELSQGMNGLLSCSLVDQMNNSMNMKASNLLSSMGVVSVSYTISELDVKSKIIKPDTSKILVPH